MHERAGTKHLPADKPAQPVEACPSISQEAFHEAVRKVKEHIVAGDIFQAVLSRRMEFPVSRDPFTLYAALREINPSPYMYYLDFGEEKVIGASPEMLVRVEKRRVTTVPIAGTRPRGCTKEEDAQLQKICLQTGKNGQNTRCLSTWQETISGGSARFGSVEVTEFMGIEKFSHVQHIVSTVSGILRDNLDCYDAFRSCFPAGTVSGAPRSGPCRSSTIRSRAPRVVCRGRRVYRF